MSAFEVSRRTSPMWEGTSTERLRLITGRWDRWRAGSWSRHASLLSWERRFRKRFQKSNRSKLPRGLCRLIGTMRKRICCVPKIEGAILRSLGSRLRQLPHYLQDPVTASLESYFDRKAPLGLGGPNRPHSRRKILILKETSENTYPSSGLAFIILQVLFPKRVSFPEAMVRWQ